MNISQKEIDLALQYAKKLKIVAKLDPMDGKTLVFERIPPIPPSITDPEIISTLEICIEYHQRCVFTGEYQNMDEHPPAHHSSDPIEDINFFLDYYKDHLISEIEKGLVQDQSTSAHEPAVKLTPFAEAMIRYRQKKKD